MASPKSLNIYMTSHVQQGQCFDLMILCPSFEQQSYRRLHKGAPNYRCHPEEVMLDFLVPVYPCLIWIQAQVAHLLTMDLTTDQVDEGVDGESA
jgi:hypothetical protein